MDLRVVWGIEHLRANKEHDDEKTSIGTDDDDDEDDNDDDLRASPSFHKLFLRSLQLPTLSYTNQLVHIYQRLLYYY